MSALMPTARSRAPFVAGGVVVAIVLGVAAFLLTTSDGDPTCAPIETNPQWSVARRWDEAVLNAVRRDLPAPTVHSRNLFHVSAAMWDAWATYDGDAVGYFVTEKNQADDRAAARNEAISYSAYRVAEHRYIDAAGGSDSIPEFDALMAALCYPINVTTTEGDTPAAIGNRIAATIIEFGLTDGSLEEEGYVDPSYAPVNEALIVDESGTVMNDPNRWQPLQIENMISQNGIPVVDGTQEFIGPHWGFVTGFALPPDADGLPVDPGPPPYLGDPATDAQFKESVVEVIEISSHLDPAANVTVDISPATLGGSPLGTDDGQGYPANPATNEPYPANLVNEAEFGRAAAEFWADGPDSETPPGHWNTLANEVSDLLAPDLRIGGAGSAVDRLEWDVKLYFALNGANHDAAIAAWGAKGFYDYVRPISMIRFMGGLGQSTDPDASSYSPDGLPLVDGLIEIITETTTVPGARHAELAGHEGEIALLAWAGNPDDPEIETGGVEWIRAVDWVPYQLPTFVTPSFAAYVSGHSSFSRASAEILAAFTGSEFFPDGLGEWTIPAGSFEFEAGPESDIVLQWATYFDASDQAGRSRLYGGIHVAADDLEGRKVGSLVGKAAWDLASDHYGGGAGG